MRAILALDQGTTGSTALVVGDDGAVLGRGYRELPQYYPQPGWVEHDPAEIWATQLDAARAALVAARVAPRDLAAIGITNQRETTLALGPARRAARPPAPSSGRVAARAASASASARRPRAAPRAPGRAWSSTPTSRERRSPGCWTTARGARARAPAVSSPSAPSTPGCSGSSPADASTSPTSPTPRAPCCFDIRDGSTGTRSCSAISASRAPCSRASSPRPGCIAETRGLRRASRTASRSRASPVTSRPRSSGRACFEPGGAKNTYGTGCFLLLHTGGRPVASRGRPATTVAWTLPDGCGAPRCYALEGCVFVAGAAVQWLRDGLGLIKTRRETEPLARSVPDTGGVYLVPAFVGLGAPHWDPYARGAFVGFTRGTTRAHVARATLEAIAYQTRDVLDAMAAAGAAPLRAPRRRRRAENDFLCQMPGRRARLAHPAAARSRDDGAGRGDLAGVLGTGRRPVPRRSRACGSSIASSSRPCRPRGGRPSTPDGGARWRGPAIGPARPDPSDGPGISCGAAEC